MYKPVMFQPQNFGGFTLSMLLSGMFIGYITIKEWYYIIPSIIIFFIGIYFYTKDNGEQE